MALGGLVGANDGTVSTSYSTGSVSGFNSVGGLIGSNGGPIRNSYATGSVSGSNYVGGLVGSNFDGAISYTYAIGRITGASSVGGLVGFNDTNSVTSSYWDTAASGLATSAAGVGMTTASMQNQANFTSATAANGNVNPNWDFTNTWVMYNGYTYPLLRAFMTPLTVSANSAVITYDNAAYSPTGVSYSTTPNPNLLLGTLNYGGGAQGPVNVGTYTLGGLYSNQQGYIITYGSNTLTINPLASVTWVGGTSGNWSNPANWAGGAIPDYGNVLRVSIPGGDTVTYDAAMASLGTTVLTSLTSAGTVLMSAGSLDTTGAFSTAGFEQTGGVLSAGTLKINATSASGVQLGDITAGVLSVSSKGGPISELSGASVDVTGATVLTAENGPSYYGITLGSSGNSFGAPITSTGSSIDLQSAGLDLGNTIATGA